MESVSDRFRAIDQTFVTYLGSKKVNDIMTDIANDNFSLREVADRNKVSCADVVQVCRFNKIDVNNNPTK